MKLVTTYWKRKYSFVGYSRFENKHILFTYYTDIGNVLDVDELSAYIFETRIKEVQMTLHWRLYLKNISRIHKKFLKKRNEIKKKAYRDLLRPHFCNDIVGVIVEYII